MTSKLAMISKSVKQTRKIASDLAHKIIKTKKGAIIALEGELGAGKTTFIQGFARALGIKPKIKSPTFVLMKKYVVPKSAKSRRRLDIQGDALNLYALNLYHLDCYRIRDHKDLKTLELKKIIHEPHNIVLIEWAERIKKILPKKHIKIYIDHISRNKRKIQISKLK